MSFRRAEDSLSGLPLGAVPAVALDLETTGLEVAKDRIVEIAAVRLQGAGGEDDHFARLVSPGIPIPPSSTRIHGITDDEVAGAEAFAAVIPEFSEWVGRCLVIGYALGFDLAVLRAEHQRHGLDWKAPRSVDVRHLVQLVAPDLPNQSLELAAKWLGVEVGERHRALGDAETAARIFKALVPRLREKGIVTLAQAERVCRNLTTRLDEEAQAGWHEVLRDSRIAPESVAEYARIDSFPYRHRVYDVMRFPAVILPPATPVREALALMMEKGISSVFVDPPQPGGSYSILTERDLLRAFNSNVAGLRDAPISHYAKGPLVSVDSEEFVYRAIASMSQRGFRHLGVQDPAGKLVGAISARDLLRQRASDALSLGDSLERAASPGDLGRIWSELTTVARGLVFEEADPRDIAAIISRELRALTRRACELAEQEMAKRGEGAPARPYAMMVLGSGGRGESLLAMDQDNAIIFDSGESGGGEPGGEADRWFEQLGTLVSDMLNEAGVVYCPGGIMAARPEWRLDMAGWRHRLETWITKARPEDLLNSDIFFDAVPVYGERALAERLYDEAQAAAGGSRDFLMAMTLKASDFRPPLNWLGRPRLENGRIDLKKSGLMPIFSAARIAALTHKLDVRSTPERLEAVRQLGAFDAAVIGRLIDAHKILLGAILRQQLDDMQHGIALSNKVAPGEMQAHERQELTWALGQVESVRDLLGAPTVG